MGLCPIIHYSSQKVSGEASITGVTQRNLGVTLPLPNSLDLLQTQKQKMKSWTDPASSFRFPVTVQVFSNPTPIVPWNYNRNRNNISENPFVKVYQIRYTFEVESDSL